MTMSPLQDLQLCVSGVLPDAEAGVPVARASAITVRLDPEMQERLRVAAVARATTTHRLVLDALARFLDQG